MRDSVFQVDNEGFTAIGFATGPDRGYIEVLITGIDFHGEPSAKQLKAFNKFCKNADEITITKSYLRAWWD